MREEELNRAVYEKYIRPTRRKKKNCIGVEIELPIVNLEKKPVDFSLVHQMTNRFVECFGFDKQNLDDQGEIYLAVCGRNGDSISYDCSYNTLELSFGPAASIVKIENQYVEYLLFLQEFLKKSGHILTGMGINPGFRQNIHRPVPTGRYRMLRHYLDSYPKHEGKMLFHKHPEFGMFSCASQVQLDVEETELPEIIHTFSRLEPFKALLFANSYWNEENGESFLCARDYFWRQSMQGFNPHNLDMYETDIASSAEMVEYIKSMSMYCLEREGKYIHFDPLPLKRFFQAEEIEGEYFDGLSWKNICIKPRLADLEYLRSFKFEDLTYRGTIEFRSVCTQPIREAMCPVAFHAGLIQNLHLLTELIDSDSSIYGHGYNAVELRKLFCREPMPEFVDFKPLKKMLEKILKLAEDGLRQRGLGEEKYLKPLYDRAEKISNPAKEMVAGLRGGESMEKYILEYAAPMREWRK